ncbi:hypothetical protein CEUSTIGMA_g5748.t1 [Chlamydomonas eustigma]|uniref:Ubiquitin carboxyl-terminal hydrolase n=1 Tax=Chlamydomonas eustigma TaxID=1157962 RepID=A0A250X5I6_9CHLO|nr:hypothetical protein CEUSTIGMA_g5748.t1 [Chlamydomonas eustigma]|eukprot:GAX78306.1 hypothetical protein CEUSTIGMA_g5748.t1 [Chlamydomonas eustigma]
MHSMVSASFGPQLSPAGYYSAAFTGEASTSGINKLTAEKHGEEHIEYSKSFCSTWGSAQKVLTGLSNLGNSCYANSVLQCLAFLPPVGNLINTDTNGLHGINCPYTQHAQSTKCAACLLTHQLKMQLSGRYQNMRPISIMRNLGVFSKTFQSGRQEDSHEMLHALIDATERDSRKGLVSIGAPKDVRTLVEDLFQGRTLSQVRCKRCGHDSNTYEAFTTLSLDIPKAGNRANVEECLSLFTAPEILDGANKYKCDRCKTLVSARKQVAIYDEPNILMIHLKRFNAFTLSGGKINRHVQYSPTLDLTPFSSTSLQMEQLGVSGSSPPPSPRSSRYMLSGIVVHSGGSIHSGHYTAYVLDSTGSWNSCNDSYHCIVGREEALSQQAYLLFYTRADMKPSRSLPAAKQQQQAGSGSSAAAASSPAVTPSQAAMRVQQKTPSRMPLATSLGIWEEAGDPNSVDTDGWDHKSMIGPQLPPSWELSGATTTAPAAHSNISFAASSYTNSTQATAKPSIASSSTVLKSHNTILIPKKVVLPAKQATQPAHQSTPVSGTELKNIHSSHASGLTRVNFPHANAASTSSKKRPLQSSSAGYEGNRESLNEVSGYPLEERRHANYHADRRPAPPSADTAAEKTVSCRGEPDSKKATGMSGKSVGARDASMVDPLQQQVKEGLLTFLRDGEFKAIVRTRMYSLFLQSLEVPEVDSRASADLVLAGRQALMVQQQKEQVLDQLLLAAIACVPSVGGSLVADKSAALSGSNGVVAMDQRVVEIKMTELRDELRAVCRNVAAVPIQGAVKRLKELAEDRTNI